MSITKHKFDELVVENSRCFGEAMVAAAKKIPDEATLSALLKLRAEHAKNVKLNLDDYELAVKRFAGEKGIVLEGKSQFDALLGYLNIKSRKPEFQPTLDDYNNNLREECRAYRATLESRPVPAEVISNAKDNLRSAIVAGQFDKGPASIIIIDAMSGKKPSTISR